MRAHTIALRCNRYLLLVWVISYLALGWVVGLLPLGSFAPLVFLLIVLLAGYSLLSRVLLIWPEAPKTLDCLVDAHGQVHILCDNQSCAHWKFGWRSRRLVVLVLFFNRRVLRWVPRFVFWLSPHNTDKETHRYLRIIARFGHKMPLQYNDKLPSSPRQPARDPNPDAPPAGNNTNPPKAEKHPQAE